jgi:C-terminal peptidase prc
MKGERLVLAGRSTVFGLVAIFMAGFILAAPAVAASIESIFEKEAKRSGIELSDEEKRLVRRSLNVIEERYIDEVAKDELIHEVYVGLNDYIEAKAKAEEKDAEDGKDKKGVTLGDLVPDKKKDDNDPYARMEFALNKALRTMDAHTGYLSPSAFNEMRVRTRGEFGGLGLEVTMRDDTVYVVAPIDDTPAFRAGMKAGDRITHVDGGAVKGLTLRQAVKRMRGKVGSKVRLMVKREGQDEAFEVVIIRDLIRIRAVRYRREDDVAYIRITAFSEKTETGIAKAVETLSKEIGSSLRGYVIDLRNNPGGLLNQAIKTADAFLDDGSIVSVRGRRRSEGAYYEAENGDLTKGRDIVVLINAGSASASEIVASALQENHRATVIGRRSFGKGSVQTIMPMGRMGALRLTTALYYAPSGETLQARGVWPDLRIEDVAAGEVGAPGVRREENLNSALDNPNDRKSEHADTPVVTGAHCKTLLKKEISDGELACALAVLRLGGIEQLAAATAAK